MTVGPYRRVDRPRPSVGRVPPKAKRVCLVTSELAGPDYNGGIGTAVRGLAQALVRNGYDVEILYTQVARYEPRCFRGSFEEQVERYQRYGISLRCLAHNGQWNDWLAKSHEVLIHLVARKYDHVFFNDMHAEGYYSLLERRTANPDFAGTTMAVVLHSATQWIAELNQQAVSSIEDIRLIEMERRCIELADAVISPSAYMLTKYKGYGWKIPERTCVIPNLLPTEAQHRSPELKTCPVEEVVFFGRLERRKGLWLFCDAIDQVKYEIGDVKITFLGKLTTEDEELSGFPLLKRAASWPFEIDIISDFDREQALNYLKAGRRVAVMPAPEDNSPCAILECLYEGIPFVASSGSGGQELIDQHCWARTLFKPTVGALTECLRSIVRNGATTGLAATRPDQNEKMILSWLGQTLMQEEAPKHQAKPPSVPASQSKRTPFHQLVLLAAPRGDVNRELVGIEHAVELLPVDTPVTVLVDTSGANTEQLSVHLDRLGARIVDVRHFEQLTKSLTRESPAVAFFHWAVPITSDWLDRAERCFRQVDDISALTGMTALPEPSEQELPYYFTLNPHRDRVLDYKIGNSPVLFPLAADTNSGFIAIRSDALARADGISPFDEQYNQFKRAQDWIHEMVVRLAVQGDRFEVLAKPVLNASLVQESSPVFWFGRTARSLVGSQLGYAPGSEQALLARMAIEAKLGAQRKRIAADSLRQLSAKLGRRLDDPALYNSEERMTCTLAAMAKASGQIELAHELTTSHLLSRRDGGHESRPLASSVRRRSTEVRLFDLAAAGAFSGFNLTHEWSFKTIGADREVEIHPNSYFEGRATVTFNDLDLTNLGVLIGAVRLASPFSKPVRFRVDIMSRDSNARFSVEHVVRASEAVRLEEQLPGNVLTRCDIVLSTEMASPSDQTEGAWARWVDLRLAGA